MMPAVFGPTTPLSASRFGTVCRIRHDDLVAFGVTTFLVIGANHGDTGQLALRACHRRQRHTDHAGHRLEHFLQFEHALHETLAVADRTERVPTCETRQQRQCVTRAWVVLHRARAQRIELCIDRKILLRQSCVMPHDLQLGGFRQQRLVVTQKRLGNVRIRRIQRRLRECTTALA